MEASDVKTANDRGTDSEDHMGNFAGEEADNDIPTTSVPSNLMSILENAKSGSDPVVKLVAGLIAYERWYSGIPKEMQLNSQMLLSTDTCGVNRNNLTDANDATFPYGLDIGLLPICWPQTIEGVERYNDYLDRIPSREIFARAVRHLKDVLDSTASLAALHPLIQLLLLNDRPKEALEELDKLCDKSNAVLPFRLRAKILECVGGKDHEMLPKCYEEILKKDPRCIFSLSGLIRLHKIGSYNVEQLVDMVTLHLDATYATCDIWGVLASCFLELQALSRCPYEDDQKLTTRIMSDDDSRGMCFAPGIVPKVFAGVQARKDWRLRCRWWTTRHFSHNAFLSEKQAGDWQLMTFKAACASHLYDEKFEYVTSVYNWLEENNDMEQLSFLQMHFQKSIKLLGNFNRTSR